MQAKSEAAEQMAEIKSQVRNDVVTGETAGEIGAIGMGVSPVQATNGADVYITLYHAYDGREVSLPSYMVEQRLTLRFPRNDSAIPPEYRGKQVWLAKRVKAMDDPKPFMCRLHVDQTEEIKAEMLKAGFTPTCRKGPGFRTQFEADEHFRIKHPRRWTAYERAMTVARESRSSDQLSTLVEAFLKVNAKEE